MAPPTPTPDELDNYLKSVYLDPAHRGSLMGLEKLYHVVRQDRRYTITRKQIFEWLAAQTAYTQNRAIKPVTRRNRVLVKGIDDQFDADLIVFADKTHWVPVNDGYRYILVVIDVFSRYVWARPLKSKEVVQVKEAFSDIFRDSRRLPRRIRSDRGSEFTSAEMRRYMKNKRVTQIFTNNELQANYVERVIKTLKSKLMRYMTDRNTRRWIDVLQDIVDSYNNTWHYGIRATPALIDRGQEKKLWWQMYWPEEPYDRERRGRMRRKTQYAFNLGDLVRLNKIKRAFQREYDQRWTGEVFRIERRFSLDRIPKYKIVDWEGEPIEGTFYQNELQRVIVPADTLFTIDYEIEEETDADGVEWVKVHYAYWPSKFDSWVRRDALVDV